MQKNQLLLNDTDKQIPMDYISQTSMNNGNNQHQVEHHLQDINPFNSATLSYVYKPHPNAFHCEPKTHLKPIYEMKGW